MQFDCSKSFCECQSYLNPILGTSYATEYPCPEGSYNALSQQTNETSCDLCPAGRYCQGQGLSAPTGNCSEGWFCTGGAAEAMPVVLGMFKDER